MGIIRVVERTANAVPLGRRTANAVPYLLDSTFQKRGQERLAPLLSYGWGLGLYLLFVDESGTHGGSHAFVLGGMAIHEADAAQMQTELDRLVIRHLGSVPVNLEDYELHATEMRNAKKPKAGAKGTQKISVWANEDRSLRTKLLREAYELVANFQPSDASKPITFFGVVLDAGFHSSWTALQREQFAYEVLLNKFDMTMKGGSDKGLVIHDRRVIAERDIQTWTSEWRTAAGSIGQLKNLADVPLFADSRASRLLQVADLVAYALYRRYEPGRMDTDAFQVLWSSFDEGSRELHGCVHYTPSYGSGCCLCEPCSARMKIESERAAKKSTAPKLPRERKRTRSGRPSPKNPSGAATS